MWQAGSGVGIFEVVRLLGLTDVRPSTWSAGVDLVDDVAHSGDGPILDQS